MKRFIDETIAKTRETGVARTLFGRERPIPDINSRNPNARGFAERTAVNSPIQGTAADLIKLAMVRIDRALAGFESRLLLQVHDELVLEAPAGEIDDVVKAREEGDGRSLRTGRAAAGGSRSGRQLARREIATEETKYAG